MAEERKQLSEKRAIKEARRISISLLDKIDEVLLPIAENDDIMNAFEVCIFLVPDAMEKYSTQTGFGFERIGIDPFNRKLAPDHYEGMILKRMSDLAGQGKLVASDDNHRVVHEDDTKLLRYIRPIVAEAPCLKCHGLRSERVFRADRFLKRFYPNETSGEFSEGDLIGALSIRIPLKQPPLY
jgi:hypothetical protein